LVVTAEAEERSPALVYEITIDGNLVHSGRVVPGPIEVPKAEGTFAGDHFTLPPGKHAITVTAPGHDPWIREVMLLTGAEKHYFHARLKRSKQKEAGRTD
jgi:hypothetical protein